MSRGVYIRILKRKTVLCKQCNSEFQVFPSIKKTFCSYNCYWNSLKGKAFFIGGMKGKKHTEEYKKLMSGLMLGKPQPKVKNEKHPAWKGDEVGYRALHHWIRRMLGTPKKCSECGKTAYGHNMHWANINHTYTRQLSDWVSLCSTCHGIYDKEKSLRTHYKL